MGRCESMAAKQAGPGRSSKGGKKVRKDRRRTSEDVIGGRGVGFAVGGRLRGRCSMPWAIVAQEGTRWHAMTRAAALEEGTGPQAREERARRRECLSRLAATGFWLSRWRRGTDMLRCNTASERVGGN